MSRSVAPLVIYKSVNVEIPMKSSMPMSNLQLMFLLETDLVEKLDVSRRCVGVHARSPGKEKLLRLSIREPPKLWRNAKLCISAISISNRRYTFVQEIFTSQQKKSTPYVYIVPGNLDLLVFDSFLLSLTAKLP